MASDDARRGLRPCRFRAGDEPALSVDLARQGAAGGLRAAPDLQQHVARDARALLRTRRAGG